MTFNKSNVIVSGSRSSLNEYANYTTVFPKPVMVGDKIVLTQDMINKQNVKYIIKWNFDLNDETLTVPEGCLIEFDGGSFSNGTLVGNETILVYNQEEEDVFKNVSLEGSFERSTSAIADKMDNTNGMAKIYLKKNKPLATQLTQPNTIYVIQYDFTLDEDITIPADCVLEFEGGSISGEHTITGANTGIQAGMVKIFSTDVTFAGTWNVAEAYPEWFDAKGDGVTDDTQALCKIVTLSKIIIFNGNKNYLFTPTNQNRISVTNHIFFGNGCTITANGASEQVAIFFVSDTQDLLTNGANVELYDMNIVGVGSYDIAPSQSPWMGSGYKSSNVVAFHCIGKSSLITKNINYKNLLFGVRSGENILITGDSTLWVENCTWDIDCILPILAQKYTLVNIKNCDVKCKSNTHVLIHHFYLSYLKGVVHIDNCNFYGGTGHALTLTSCEKEIFVSGCYFDTNNYSICCDFDTEKIIFDNCIIQGNKIEGALYIQESEVLFSNCVIKNNNSDAANYGMNLVDTGTIVEFIGCVLYSDILYTGSLPNSSIILISNSILNLSSSGSSIRDLTSPTDSKILISHSTINTELEDNGVLAEISNAIVCKIIDCIINRKVLGNFLFAPDANQFDNFYFNNCIAYNVSAMFAGWVTPKGNVTGSQII